MRRLIITACVLCLTALPATAQTVINPSKVSFNVSADHDALIDGQPMVQGYEIRFYAAGATAPQQVSPVGKPAPDASGRATVDIATVILAFPVNPAVTYTARVAALGPTGEGVSEPSGPFVRAAPIQPPANVILSRP